MKFVLILSVLLSVLSGCAVTRNIEAERFRIRTEVNPQVAKINKPFIVSWIVETQILLTDIETVRWPSIQGCQVSKENAPDKLEFTTLKNPDVAKTVILNVEVICAKPGQYLLSPLILKAKAVDPSTNNRLAVVASSPSVTILVR